MVLGNGKEGQSGFKNEQIMVIGNKNKQKPKLNKQNRGRAYI
jgi:hypothetical protein